jgi:hypothetical protein
MLLVGRGLITKVCDLCQLVSCFGTRTVYIACGCALNCSKELDHFKTGIVRNWKGEF